jgi:hypothetical protein
VPIVLKSGSLNLLETSKPVQALMGLLYLYLAVRIISKYTPSGQNAKCITQNFQSFEVRIPSE